MRADDVLKVLLLFPLFCFGPPEMGALTSLKTVALAGPQVGLPALSEMEESEAEDGYCCSRRDRERERLKFLRTDPSAELSDQFRELRKYEQRPVHDVNRDRVNACRMSSIVAGKAELRRKA